MAGPLGTIGPAGWRPVKITMPELPDVVLYIEALEARVLDRTLETGRILNPFVLRSVEPPLDSIEGQKVQALTRVGKRIAVRFANDHILVIHLMIAGRLRWRDLGTDLGLSRKLVLATFAFDTGSLVLTEAGSTRRASIQLVHGEAGLRALDPGGLEPLEASVETFSEALTRENHTLKRALTDPQLFSGIGNAYSDEILHAAQLSPLKLTQALSGPELDRLYQATRATLSLWIDRLRREAAGRFPEKVTAFREGMAVHGRFKQPCPVCGAPVQRIVYAANECNYCAPCQTGGRVLADRSLSRLLGRDWPPRLE
jgi:formamidopyrimidine-DNA glycosylase